MGQVLPARDQVCISLINGSSHDNFESLIKHICKITWKIALFSLTLVDKKPY